MLTTSRILRYVGLCWRLVRGRPKGHVYLDMTQELRDVMQQWKALLFSGWDSVRDPGPACSIEG